MNGLTEFWDASDAIGRLVAVALLAMSVASWVTLLWKAWLLARVRRDLPRAVLAFWEAPDFSAGAKRLAAFDREAVLAPLVAAASVEWAAGSLQAQANPASQLTRRLRDALHAGLRRLGSGQVVLASIGSTAPFVGLFGTVWGIYHALLGMAGGGSMSIEQVSGPVGEALIMTAAGLAVAIPAVLAYNLFNQWLAALEAELEGFAQDLRDMNLPAAARAASGSAASTASGAAEA